MILSKADDSKARLAKADALVKCLEQGGERIQDEAIGFEKALRFF